MHARIQSIDYYLPAKILNNEDLAAEFPNWSIERIASKTGILERRICDSSECASDLGVKATEKLFRYVGIQAADIDYVLFCSQSPDHLLPSTACLIQERLKIPTTAGALDFNLGCSGFIYGLGLAKGLIETGQSRNLLLITAETYSKLIHAKDRSVRTIFGDAGAATLITATSTGSTMGPFLYGTDGTGGSNLIVPAGGARQPMDGATKSEVTDEYGNVRTAANLYMNGSRIFDFTLESIPRAVGDLLARTSETTDSIDLFVFHQANKFMLEHLRKKCGIPSHKFFTSYEYTGNTVSCTIPIALAEAQQQGVLSTGMRIMLVGLGVGYSWGACLIQW